MFLKRPKRDKSDPKKTVSLKGITLTERGFLPEFEAEVSLEEVLIRFLEDFRRDYEKALEELGKIVSKEVEKIRKGKVKEVKVKWKPGLMRQKPDEVAKELEQKYEALKILIHSLAKMAEVISDRNKLKKLTGIKKGEELGKVEGEFYNIFRKVLVWVGLLANHDEEGFGYAMRGVVMGDGSVNVDGKFIEKTINRPGKGGEHGESREVWTRALERLRERGVLNDQDVEALQKTSEDPGVYALLAAATLAEYGYKANVYPGAGEEQGQGVYKIQIRGEYARKLAAAIPTFKYDEILGNEKAKKLKALLDEVRPRKLRSPSPPGWPDFSVQMDKGELRVEHNTRRREQMEEVVARLRAMGLAEGTDYRRYSGRYMERLRITPDGVRRLAHIAKHAEDPRTREGAAALLTYFIETARDGRAMKRLKELAGEA